MFFIKKLATILLALLVCTCVYADDVIVMRNGDVINAKILEITQTEIKYKKASRPDGPTYTINKSDVLAINYEDGEKETFGDDTAVQKEQPSAGPVISEAVWNTEINRRSVAALNSFIPVYSMGDVSKSAESVLIVFNAMEESVLSDENIDIMVETGERAWDRSGMGGSTISGFGEFESNPIGSHMRFKVYNKTARIIHIDLQNSFMVRGGMAQSYYVPKATTTGHSSTSGIGVNLGSITPLLGGVSVGHSNTTGKSVTVYSQRVLQIPPKSFVYLEANGIFIDINSCETTADVKKYNSDFAHRMSGDGWSLLGVYLSANFNKKEKPKRGQVLEFSPSDLSTRLGNILTYSFDSEFTSATVVSSMYFVRYMVGYSLSSNSRDSFRTQIMNQFPGVERGFTTGVPVTTNTGAAIRCKQSE